MIRTRPGVFIATLLAAGTLAYGADSPSQPRDFTSFKLEELGVTPVKETTDPATQFKTGGKNATAAIVTLTALAGRSIAELEADMRPGKMSGAGFLGAQENLLDVLTADNRFVVDEHRLTHQQLALHLLSLAGIATWQLDHQEASQPFLYHGRRFRVKLVAYRGFQKSPFQDETKTNMDATLENLDNEQKLKYSLLVPLMIERYGFYEGSGTPYRVDPKQVLQVLDFLDSETK